MLKLISMRKKHAGYRWGRRFARDRYEDSILRRHEEFERTQFRDLAQVCQEEQSSPVAPPPPPPPRMNAELDAHISTVCPRCKASVVMAQGYSALVGNYLKCPACGGAQPKKGIDRMLIDMDSKVRALIAQDKQAHPRGCQTFTCKTHCGSLACRVRAVMQLAEVIMPKGRAVVENAGGQDFTVFQPDVDPILFNRTIHWRCWIDNPVLTEKGRGYEMTHLTMPEMGMRDVDALCGAVNTYFKGSSSTYRVANHKGEIIAGRGSKPSVFPVAILGKNRWPFPSAKRESALSVCEAVFKGGKWTCHCSFGHPSLCAEARKKVAT